MCDTPFNVRNPKFHLTGRDLYIPVPCGKCPACKQKRTSHWSFRMMQETKRHKNSHFITFTYETPPISGNGFPTLRPADWQKFIRAYRHHFRYRAVNPDTGRRKWYYDKVPKIRYYVAGEYGEERGRPHYHAVCYGMSPVLASTIWQSVVDGAGHTFTGNLTFASAGYTAKYINKFQFKRRHERDDRHPEFSLMSKGLGSNYLSDAMVKYHQSDISRNYAIMDGGHKVSLPRYYRLRVYDEFDRARQSEMILQQQREAELTRQADHIRKFGSIDGYTRAQHEARSRVIDRFNNSPKRKDL